jgi:prevent-host-death family protein
MLDLNNSQSLTDFEQRARDAVAQVKATGMPLVITVDGTAEVVVQTAAEFQALLARLQQAEEELYQIKLGKLRQDLAVGVEALEQGRSTTYDEASLPTLLEKIKTQGRQRLGQ